MAITDYTSLRSEVQAWCGRSDSTFAARFPTFVALVEDRIYLGQGQDRSEPLYSEPVRASMMETSATVTVTAGVGTLPTRCLSVRRITRGTTDTAGLDYMAPDQLAMRLAESDTGNPGYYTVEGTSIKLAPSYTGDITVTYYQRFAPVTSDAPTGSMIEEHGQLYFAACMYEAFAFMQETDLALSWLARYRSHASGVNQTSADLRYSGRRLRIHARPIE